MEVSIKNIDALNAVLTVKISNDDYKSSYDSSLKNSIKDADAIMLMTKWSNFKDIDKLINKICPEAVVIDGRRIIEPKSVKNYFGIGLS